MSSSCVFSASPAILCSSSFFFNDTATTEIYTLSLHDALPISQSAITTAGSPMDFVHSLAALILFICGFIVVLLSFSRSEEHTSELQSHLNLVCRLLLEKKNKPAAITIPTPHEIGRSVYPEHPV